MKLYFASNTCSFSPHIVLQELGLPYELVRVNNKTKQTSDGRDFRTISPKGYVAALELDDGEILTEGPAIVQYLADLRPEKKLAPVAGTLERVRLQEWLAFINSEVHAGLAPLFNPNFSDDVKTIFREKMFKRFDFLETTLSKQEFLLGSSFSVADAYLFTVLGWTKFFDIDLAKWPGLDRFSKTIAKRPSVIKALEAEAAI